MIDLHVIIPRVVPSPLPGDRPPTQHLDAEVACAHLLRRGLEVELTDAALFDGGPHDLLQAVKKPTRFLFWHLPTVRHLAVLEKLAEEAGDPADAFHAPPMLAGGYVATHFATALPLEVHLMIREPERHLEAFARAGAASLIVHVEACPHLHRTAQRIKELDLGAGVALNPGTPARWLHEVLPDLDLALVMTVNPGFGGQAFIDSMLDKVAKVRGWIETRGLDCELEVDGGIDSHTAPCAVDAGADVLVAGTAVFGHAAGAAAGLKRLRAAVR